MTVEVDAARAARIKDLFKDPTLEGMLDLEWTEFEDFVQYVFERAGYAVQKVSSDHRYHVDLLVRRTPDGPVEARVEVRCYRTALVKRAVLVFLGGLVAEGEAHGYLVTTSDFTQPARDLAQTLHGRVHLVNGQQLLRYIRYVRGSRLTEEEQEEENFQSVEPDPEPSLGFAVPDEPPVAPTYLLQADALARRDPQQTTVLAVVNNKGGVAKTTTTLNTALVLAERHGQRVLVVDMDGQASLTSLLPTPPPPRVRRRRGAPAPLPPTPPSLSLMDYFQRRATLRQLVRLTRFERVWLVPADERLFLKDLSGATRPELLAFVRDLHDAALVAPDGLPFDWILLDTAPAQNFYTRTALAACHNPSIHQNPGRATTQACQRQIAQVYMLQVCSAQVQAVTFSLRLVGPVHRPAHPAALMRRQQPFDVRPR